LNILEFGRKLIATQDLDPVYTMLYGARLEEKLLKRWLLAYWCFYHSGVASKIAESNDWFKEALALYPNCPRGAERRHFRGKNGMNAISFLKARFPNPEDAVTKLQSLCPATFPVVCAEVLSWNGFGPWMAFKICDMVERLLKSKIDFGSAKLELYDHPAKAALMIAPNRNPSETARALAAKLNADYCLKAPPDFSRPLNVQESETILCKYKAHLNGHYTIGKDSVDLKKSLVGWGNTAQRLVEFVP
jgi:hypothetical protein